MLVLALDTTTPAGSCAVARDGVVLRERSGDSGRPHDVRMPGELMMLLDEERLTLPDIDVFAVATGPGSFTGLRVGIATMQGLAFAEGKPLIGVSAFDALVRLASSPGPLRGTRPADHDGAGDVGRVLRPSASSGRPEPVEGRSGPATRVATWVEAWRGEVYAAVYEGDREIEPPSVEHPDRLLERYAAWNSIHFIGGAAHTRREAILAALGDLATIAEPAAPSLSGTIALMATESVRAGNRPQPHAIRPLYIRRPDATPARDARPVG
jgi:tRNA threonylcarbamoyl adenosine modification protein YeaZ